MNFPAYLANQPASADLLFLVVALVLFAVGAVMAVVSRAWVAALECAGLAFFALAFLVT